MKRALLPVVAAAVLTLTAACGSSDDGGSADASATQTPSDSATTSDSEAGSETSSGGTVAEVNDQVRTTCQDGVVGQAAGATFAGPGTLRAVSDPTGKLYTVTGTADVGGTDTPYTCTVLVSGADVELQDATVG